MRLPDEQRPNIVRLVLREGALIRYTPQGAGLTLKSVEPLHPNFIRLHRPRRDCEAFAYAARLSVKSLESLVYSELDSNREGFHMAANDKTPGHKL